MSDVFLAYKRDDDADKALFIRGQLEKVGVSVFQDVDIGIEGHGSDYRRELETSLKQARAIVVIWTKDTIGNRGGWVGLPPFGGPGAKLVHRRSHDDGGVSERR